VLHGVGASRARVPLMAIVALQTRVTRAIHLAHAAAPNKETTAYGPK